MTKPSKTNLIILNGWGYPQRIWKTLVSLLANDFDTHILDLSDLMSPTSDWQDYTSVLAERLADLKTHFMLMGWSTGALIALEATAKQKITPDRLILLSPTAKFCADKDYPSGQPLANLRALRRNLQRCPPETLLSFYRLSNAPRRQTEETLQLLADETLKTDLPPLFYGLRYLEKTDLRSLLPRVNIPVCLLHGIADQVIPKEASAYLFKYLPKPSLRLLEAGHALPIQVPEDLASFLQGLSQT